MHHTCVTRIIICWNKPISLPRHPCFSREFVRRHHPLYFMKLIIEEILADTRSSNIIFILIIIHLFQICLLFWYQNRNIPCVVLVVLTELCMFDSTCKLLREEWLFTEERSFSLSSSFQPFPSHPATGGQSKRKCTHRPPAAVSAHVRTCAPCTGGYVGAASNESCGLVCERQRGEALRFGEGAVGRGGREGKQ